MYALVEFDLVLHYNGLTAFAISFKDEGDDDDDVVYDYAPAAWVNHLWLWHLTIRKREAFLAS